MKASEKTEVSKVKEEMEIALAEWKTDYYEENVSLEGRSATTASGATVSYEEDGIMYEAKKGNSYIGILDNGRIDRVELIGVGNSEEGEGTSLTDYEWTANIPTDNWFAKESYYNTKWNGDGTQESPYLIKTVKDLAGLSYKVASGETYNNSTYFKLMKDLNMKNHIWIPIGGHTLENISEDGKYYKKDDQKIFKGNFNGNGFSISGLYFNNDDKDYGVNVGLFGYVSGTSNTLKVRFEKIKIIDSYINGRDFIGGICGRMLNTEVLECESDLLTMGKYIVAGMIGYTSNVNINKSISLGKVILKNSSDSTTIMGGLCGSCTSSVIANSICDALIVNERTAGRSLTGRNNWLDECYIS